eukprot:CAMPEP_0182850160 /NCGR_PEP_ID=MMETSP0006_2-20121128/29939_1 /TAXON_ID=97485 /ORGANISM="Prymnesium parvum, Strain Texoma1" /LENGTH=138 /DNA_ID=CAMNT_0024980733 /DNA_START=855 /DNA_END=1272 /DNA_ORIENTATION=-
MAMESRRSLAMESTYSVGHVLRAAPSDPCGQWEKLPPASAKVMAIDMLIKTLRWVTLSDNDISNVAEAVRSCLSIPAAVNGLQLLSDAASEHSSMSALPQHGWRDRSTPPPPPYTHYVNGAWKPLYESVLKYMVRAAD